MQNVKKSAAIVTLLLILSACGQRGPLYLPEATPESNQTAPATEPESSTESK